MEGLSGWVGLATHTATLMLPSSRITTMAPSHCISLGDMLVPGRVSNFESRIVFTTRDITLRFLCPVNVSLYFTLDSTAFFVWLQVRQSNRRASKRALKSSCMCRSRSDRARIIQYTCLIEPSPCNAILLQTFLRY